MVDNKLTPGLTTVKIADVHQLDNEKIRTTYKQLLKSHVKDQDLLNLLTLDENIKRLHYRFSYIFNLVSTSDQSLGTLKIVGEKTLTELHMIFLNNTNKGMTSKETYSAAEHIARNYGLQYQVGKSDSPLKVINCTITFVKGK